MAATNMEHDYLSLTQSFLAWMKMLKLQGREGKFVVRMETKSLKF